MLTAIIVARESSSRLKQKHFYFLKENLNIFDNIIFNLKKSKFISNIVFATGSKKKNYNYLSYFNKKGIKTYNHDNESNVTNRIYLCSKEIKTEYSVLISGDCPVPDASFIDFCYRKLKNNSQYDFLQIKKKVNHEGITLFKNNKWREVNKYSKRKIFKENPGYILKKKSELFKILCIKPRKKDLGLKARLSIDTLSDLYFFQAIAQLNIKKKFLEYEDVVNANIKKYNVLNNSVKQINPTKIEKRKIKILTISNKKYGLGHLIRSKVIYDSLIERSYKNVEICLIKSSKNQDLKKILSFRNYLYLRNSNLDCNYLIIDLPEEELKKIKTSIENLNSKIILVDTLLKLRKIDIAYVIPAINANHKNKNIYSGINNLILDKKILLEKLKKVRKKIDYLFVTGGTKLLSASILGDIIQNKYKNYLIVLGPFISKEIISFYKKKRLNFIQLPNNFYEIINQSKKVFCYFGVTTLEIIAMGKKPIIMVENDETKQRLKDINYLFKKNLAIPYYFNIKEYLNDQLNHSFDIDFNCKFLDKIINSS